MDFALEWRDRRVGPNQTPRRFLDFVVDGASLYEGHGIDFIAALGWLKPQVDEQVAQRLLTNEGPELEGRVALYICPECGDLDCGAVTAKIQREGDEVVWRETAFSSIDWSAEEWRHDPTGFEDWQELRFATSEYEEAILGRPKPKCPPSGL